jgi:predicted dinucleotide-binding enzyme
MKIAILGTGEVGKALARGFLATGHDVMMGAREAGNPKAAAFVAETGGKATQGSFADAAKFGELAVLCTLGAANAAVLAAAGPHLGGKILVDTTNPLDFSKGMPPSLLRSGNDSGGEEVQRLVPTAKVVKAWNTVGNPHMFRPEFPGGPPDMFIAGNDEAAKAQVGAILRDFGWGVIDCGDIASSRYLEGMCLVWVLSAGKTGNWNQAFKMLRK